MPVPAVSVRRWSTALHGDSESFRFTISPFLRIVIRVAWPRLKDQKTNIRKSVVANAAAVFKKKNNPLLLPPCSVCPLAAQTEEEEESQEAELGLHSDS